MTDDGLWAGYVADSWARFERGEIAAELERLVLPYVKSPPRDVLDVGAGPGHFLATVRRYYPDAALSGLDADAAHVDVARKDLADRGVLADLLVASGAEIPFASSRFDLVICQMVMPYSRDDQAFVTELARVLRPGGVLWFATHGFGFYAVRIRSRGPREKLRYAASIVAGAASVVSGWKAIDDTPVTFGWVARALGSAGLEVCACERRGSYLGMPKFIHASARKPRS